MNPKSHSEATFLSELPQSWGAVRAFGVASLVAMLLLFSTIPSKAATYYWDTNDSTAGFGTAGGTWSAPTTNNSTQGWSTSSAGTAVLSGTTNTTNSDPVFFGTGSNGLGAGTVIVSGTGRANSIIFGSASGNITLAGANQTVIAFTGNITVDSSYATIVPRLGGINGLTKTGSGTLAVSMASTYSGSTTVNGGTLRLENLLTNGGTNFRLILTSSNDFFINNGSTLVIHSDVGGENRVNSANKTYTFGSTGGGTLEWSQGDMLLSTAPPAYHRIVTQGGLQNVMTTTNGARLNGILGNGTVEFNVADGSDDVDLLASSYFFNINITKNGTGTMSITTSTFGNYSVTVDQGTLDIGGSATLAGGTYSSILTTNGTFSYSSSATQRITSAVVGTGGVTVNGTGSMILTGANTFTGSTAVTAGTLQLGAGGTAGTLSTSSAISTGSGGVFSINRTNTVTQGTDFSGSAITGTGGFLQNGSGTTVLTADNTYSGSTTINTGTLQIDGNIANSGLVINSGGTISPGTTAVADSFGTSSITINGGGYNWTLNTASGSAGSGWDQITSTGALTSSGLLTVYAYGTPGDWDNAASYSWDIISANSASGFSAGNFAIDFTNFGIAAGNRTGTWSFSNPSGGIIRLSYTAAGDPAWTGGTGNWDTGFTPAVTEGDTIAFSGTGGTATNNISNGTLTTVNNIEFRNGAGAYTLAANAGSAGASGGMALTVNGLIINNSLNSQTLNTDLAFAATRTVDASTGDITIGGAISGSGGLTKNGTNQLTLSGTNTYAGATTVNGGTLTLSGGNAISNTGAIIIASGAGVNFTASEVIGSIAGAGNVTLASGSTLTLGFDNTNTTLSGVISGVGSLTKNGTGTLTLSNSNSYTGQTSLENGTIVITSSGGLGTNQINIIRGVATLELGADGLSLSNKISYGNFGVGFKTVQLDLDGTNTGTISGELDMRLGAAGAGDIRFNVGADDTLTLSGNLVVGGGGGSGLAKLGSGTLVLSGSQNNYLGTTVINAGTLQIGAGGTTGKLNGSIYGVTNNGALVFNRSDALTVENVISGTGSVTQNGTGTLTLNAANTFTGNTVVNSGTLQANASGALASTGAIKVNGGSLLVGASNAIGNSTTIELAGGTLAFSGNVTDTIGALTLSANSVIDLGTGSVVAIFADLFMGNYTLAVHNWTGTTLWNGGTGNNTDQIYFNRALGSGELDRISFYSDFGSSFVGTGFQLGLGSGFQYEVIPVPEPETWLAAALLLISGGIWLVRTRLNPTGAVLVKAQEDNGLIRLEHSHPDGVTQNNHRPLLNKP